MLRRIAAVLVAIFALALPGRAEEPAKQDKVHLLGVVSFYYPRLMYLKYQPLVDHLNEHTGLRWDLRISTTYQQTVDELCADRLTLAYLGPLTYVRAHASCGAEPLVRLQTGERSTYRSYILVREDSPYGDLADLKGKRLAFGSPLSTSSHLVPRGMLEDAGIEFPRDMRCTYLEHHERAARAVLLGEADACGVRDLVGERFLGRGLRVLARSRPIPNFPFVISPGSPPELRRELVRALVELPHEVPAIAETMAKWDEEISSGFVLSTDAEYDGVRKLAEHVLGEGALALPEGELRCSGSGQ